jgi:CheY-like chemotaxis protein
MEQKANFILCVDDDPDFLEFYREIFSAGGYRVDCFTNQQEALSRMAEETPDLVVTDLMMESLSAGFSFSRAIKEDGRFNHIPVIVITAIGGQRGFNFTPRGPEDLEAMGADAYFDKPVAPEVLLCEVQQLLARGLQAGHGGNTPTTPGGCADD